MKKLRNISKERHLQNLRRSVDRSDSSWRWGDWEGRWCWSVRSYRTWWDPRTSWTPWFHSAQSYPDLSDQKQPKTKSVKSPTNWEIKVFMKNKSSPIQLRRKLNPPMFFKRLIASIMVCNLLEQRGKMDRNSWGASFVPRISTLTCLLKDIARYFLIKIYNC